jgi:folate-dependent phosphoribosylglycinamide formyltransferase PurN
MQYLDLTLLVDYDPGFSAIAYLETMKDNGYLPKKIIRLAFTKSKHVKRLSLLLGETIAYGLFGTYIRWQKRKTLDHLSGIEQDIKQSLGYDIRFFEKIRLEEYTQEVETLYLNSYQDKRFLGHIYQETCKTFLYASSGIVHESFLSIPDVRIIHIHPGIIPDIKGSDGLFYSYLLRGRLGYSLFYMDAGLDTGDIIMQKEWDFPSIQFTKNYSEQHIYDGILAFLDSHYRAKTLLELLQNNAHDLNKLPCDKQNPKDGKTYFIMHHKLRYCIVKEIKKV